MDEIRCIRRPIVKSTISPLSYSYSDVRRISALKAKARLIELINKQSKSIEKQGRYCVLNDSYIRLTPGVTQAQINLITSQWEDVLRCHDLYGRRLLIYILQHCPKVRALHKDFYSMLPDKPNVPDALADRYGAMVIRQMSCVIFNLNRAPVVESIVRDTFHRLEQLGYTAEIVEEIYKAFLAFMKHYFSVRWLNTHNDAWSKVVKIIIKMGDEKWTNRKSMSIKPHGEHCSHKIVKK